MHVMPAQAGQPFLGWHGNSDIPKAMEINLIEQNNPQWLDLSIGLFWWMVARLSSITEFLVMYEGLRYKVLSFPRKI
ncbi:hypothetical protein Loa_00110 [Legionella oakridgensis ATCC 33761 = DSM 21215]|uniref:Uncharacterized protein n=2 Tax=Legionella oakridgensis TaxID=29423 RepID=W0BAH9_9GAMM|nr:hypothetical protein Loa_00110 [Legionella oakridgensis ATCC 33761 = DSM 21215]KTD38222.1 hypothetical protein Loak_1898 [Legionella oakridgensis]STY15648.1 Uncharacterised protein [Legionella longbeachae]